MNIGIEAFRSLANGKYNLGSVVLNDNNQLEKVNNHQWVGGNDQQVTAEQNQRVREALYAAVRSEVQGRLGLASETGNAFLRELRAELLGDATKGQLLERQGALASTLAKMDTFLYANANKSLGARNIQAGAAQEDVARKDKAVGLVDRFTGNDRLMSEYGLDKTSIRRIFRNAKDAGFLPASFVLLYGTAFRFLCLTLQIRS